jgi:hypothetical protein
MAGLLCVPAPGSDFIATERDFLKSNYAALSDATQDSVAHVERDYPVMVMMMIVRRRALTASNRPMVGP